jgi:hypothetical protein
MIITIRPESHLVVKSRLQFLELHLGAFFRPLTIPRVIVGL